VMDPFAAQPHLILFCDILEPTTGQPYDRDPRSTARRAEAYIKETGLADQAWFGPELEFFVFDDVRFDLGRNKMSYEVDDIESPLNSGRTLEGGNTGHRPAIKGGYFPVPPIDSGTDLRAEMLAQMATMGMPVEKHHHEVAPSQHELGFRVNTLLKQA